MFRNIFNLLVMIDIMHAISSCNCTVEPPNRDTHTTIIETLSVATDNTFVHLLLTQDTLIIRTL